MAQVFGTPGRNAIDESIKQTKRIVLAAMAGILVLGVLEGYLLGGYFPLRGLPIWSVIVFGLAAFPSMFLLDKWVTKKMDAAERERAAWRKGARGEESVAVVLEYLPDEYVVIHDVTKLNGNIDHVVIGPTGVYVLDAKNWNGTIQSDGSGELLYNGKLTAKPQIKHLTRSVMDFQGKLKALTDRDYFVRGLMVFPTAYVEAKFGTTGHIHCLRGDRLVQYIQDQTYSKGLTAQDIDRIRRAVLQMAGMDKSFPI